MCPTKHDSSKTTHEGRLRYWKLLMLFSRQPTLMRMILRTITTKLLKQVACDFSYSDNQKTVEYEDDIMQYCSIFVVTKQKASL